MGIARAGALYTQKTTGKITGKREIVSCWLPLRNPSPCLLPQGNRTPRNPVSKANLILGGNAELPELP